MYDTKVGFVGNGGDLHLDSLIDVLQYSHMFKSYLNGYDGCSYRVVNALFAIIDASLRNINKFYNKYQSDYDIFTKNLTVSEFQLFLTYCENFISSIEQLHHLGVNVEVDSNYLDGVDLFQQCRGYGLDDEQRNSQVFMNLRAVFGEHTSSIRLKSGSNISRYVVESIFMGSLGVIDSSYNSAIGNVNSNYDIIYHQYAYGDDYQYKYIHGDQPHGLALLIGYQDVSELVRLNIFDIYEYIYLISSSFSISIK